LHEQTKLAMLGNTSGVKKAEAAMDGFGYLLRSPPIFHAKESRI
jgi:hypothetical protein